MRDGDAVPGVDGDVVVGQVHRVRGQHSPAERAAGVEHRRHRAVGLADVGVLAAGLRDVGVQQRPRSRAAAATDSRAPGGSVYAECGP